MADSSSREDLDFTALRELADSRLTLSDLFAHYGKPVAHPTRWTTCPDCGKEGGKFRIRDEKTFKCVMPSCRLNPDNFPADVHANGQGLVAIMEGLPSKEAFFKYLRLADAIDEETYERLTNPQARAKQTKKKERKATPAAPKAEEPTKEAAEPVSAKEPPSLSQEEPPERRAAPFASDGNAWHDLWKSMRLADGDRTKLVNERGLSPKTIEECGFRTSRPSNIQLIEELRKSYEDDDLVELGILRNDDERGYRPEPQLCGWGITKEKDPETGKHRFDQTNPVLIPYFNQEGAVVTMRAHKGGLPKRILPGEINYTNYSRPYGIHFLAKRERKTRWCVITEGEIKAAAAWQCGLPVLAVPGISFVNNEGFREELLRVLRFFRIEEVVIIYDNEVKDDPALPGFKEDENDRYDVYVWANVLARHLERAGLRSVKIGQLPDEYRVKGKTDFDGILKTEVDRADGKIEAGTKTAAKVFDAVVQSAAKPVAFLNELFPTRAQQIIHSKVIRYTRERMIAIGGDDERTKAWLFRYSHPALGQALRETDGAYYVRKNPPNEKVKEWRDERSQFIEKIKQMEGNGTSPRDIRMARIEVAIRDELLLGWPERISNFSLECLYKVKGEETGEFEYYCKAWIPEEHKTMLLRIPAKKLARLAEFRQLTLERLGSTFKGGERDLQAITEDLNTDSRYRNVNEVNAYGYHAESGLFLWGDCAWTPHGERVLPDKEMVFWHGDAGYQIDANPERVGEGFDQGAPLMRPDTPTLSDLDQRLTEWCVDIRDTLGGMEGWAIVGAAIGYLAMPAFFRQHGSQHPGIWLHGTYGDGKSQTAKWLSRLHGFDELNAPGLDAATPVALSRVLAQYSMMIVYLDEYRGSSISEDKNAMLRYAFDRSSAPKGRIDNMRRTRSLVPTTTPMVCGESECFDAATRSRYVQTVVSKAKRKPDPGNARFRRLQEFAPHLYQVSRCLMDQRPQFELAFMTAYDHWRRAIEQRQVGKKINDRAGVTYGVAYAGMFAMVEILRLGKLEAAIQSDFLDFLLDYMTMADADTKATGIIESFWEQFIAAARMRVISACNLSIIWAQPHEDKEGALRRCHEHAAGAREVLVINRSDAFLEYEEFLRKRGREVPVTAANLKKYLSNQPYWAWRYSKEGWKWKFNSKTAAAWGIYLDEFPWADEIRDVVEEEAESML